MTDKPDLNKLFKVDDDSLKMRKVLSELGHFIRKQLATGKQTICFEIDRDIAAVMADTLVIDEHPQPKPQK